MGNFKGSFLITLFLVTINLASLLPSSFACGCDNAPPLPPKHPQLPALTPPTPRPPPPHVPKPPTAKPPPPPFTPTNPPPPPHVPRRHPPPPPFTSPPRPSSPPPPAFVTPPPPKPETCPMDGLKLRACVDVLGGSILHLGLGEDAKRKCCPLLDGLLDLDAAVCLCTTIRARLPILNQIVLPITLKVLVGCEMNPPTGFDCPVL